MNKVERYQILYADILYWFKRDQIAFEDKFERWKAGNVSDERFSRQCLRHLERYYNYYLPKKARLANKLNQLSQQLWVKLI